MSANTPEALFPASTHAMRTTNPIRAIVDRVKPDPANPKSYISLSIGDPTIGGFAKSPQVLEDTLIDVIKAHSHDGYAQAIGHPSAREAVSQYLTKLIWRGIHQFLGCQEPREHQDGSCDSHCTEQIDLCSSKPTLPFTLSGDRVVIASGASHALELLITSLCNPGDVFLIPRPAFALFRTICESHGIQVEVFPLKADREWEVDIGALRKLVASIRSPKTAGTLKRKIGGMIVINPSNPCGSNYHPSHVMELLKVATELDIPLVADEVYAEFGFNGFSNDPDIPGAGESLAEQGSFFSFGAASTLLTMQPDGLLGTKAQTESDVLRSKGPSLFIIGAISKALVAPGFRLGWVAAPRFDHRITDPQKPVQITHHDSKTEETLSFMTTARCTSHNSDSTFPNDAILHGIHRLATLIIGANTLIQGVLPRVLSDTPPSFFVSLRTTLFRNALQCYKLASSIPGLKPVRPRASMFMMVELCTNQLGSLSNDVEFCQKLIQVENVLVLPGSIFEKPSFVRISLLGTPDVLDEAFCRIRCFIETEYCKP